MDHHKRRDSYEEKHRQCAIRGLRRALKQMEKNLDEWLKKFDLEEAVKKLEKSRAKVVNTDDVVVLLRQWQQEQQQYEQKVLEVQTFISDQTKNITSLFFLLVLAVGLMSGIVLAKAVWRKF